MQKANPHTTKDAKLIIYISTLERDTQLKVGGGQNNQICLILDKKLANSDV